MGVDKVQYATNMVIETAVNGKSYFDVEWVIKNYGFSAEEGERLKDVIKGNDIEL